MSTPKITAIHHVCLKCPGEGSFAQTVRFYHDLLGMPIVRTWKGAAMLDTGAGLLEIFDSALDLPAQGPLRHIAFTVEDVGACVDAVRGAGYEITMEPTDIVIPSDPPYPARIAFCIGPVGEEIEFFCPK